VRLARMRPVDPHRTDQEHGSPAGHDAHPREPHYYLASLGVAPEAQGNGVGSRLLGPMLERCDREGVPAYLESSRDRNVPFYERHGFRVTDELRLPLGGPTLWLMWREPAGARTAP
jgi:GNAT superfamily N-acetyltransferase